MAKTPVYLDESGFRETDFRRYAYAPKGVRVEDKIPGSHRYTRTTLIAARLDGCFIAPVLFEGSCVCGCLQCMAFRDVVSIT